jgi:excisionase family DNA binding protein
MTRYLSVKQYAERRGVHVETVKRWIASGYLTAERTGPRGWMKILVDTSSSVADCRDMPSCPQERPHSSS